MRTYGIDVNALARERYTGTERYVLELMHEMMRVPLEADERVWLYSSRRVEALGELPQGWEWRILKWPGKGWTHIRLSWELLRRPPSVFFSPAHEIPLLHRRAKIVNTVHDIAFEIVPEVYSSMRRSRQRWAVKRAIKKASKILTVSQATADDLHTRYRVSYDRMQVTPLAIHPERFEVDDVEIARVMHKLRLHKGLYFLCVGRVEKKKNILTLIDAFDEFKHRRGVGDPVDLVLAGSFGHGEHEIQKRIERSPARRHINVPGYVEDEDLPGLFGGALAYTFPSRYEGFGIPALEAMAAGVPLLASEIPALREVAGHGALFASPDVVDGWADNMERIQYNEALRRELVQAGRERLKAFSWKRTAARTLEALRSI